MLKIIILDIIVLFIIFFFGAIFNKEILIFLDNLCFRLRIFIHRNESFFTILFLSLFFIEQLILVLLFFYFKSRIDILQIAISIFALIVVTTASLQKILLEIRARHYKEQVLATQRLVNKVEKWFEIKEVNKSLKEK